MADQEWGRAERIIFPPRQPIYTYGAVIAAFILSGFLIWIHFPGDDAFAAGLHARVLQIVHADPF